MNYFRLLPLALLAINVYAQDVRYNYDHSADFAKFKTYKWVDIKGSAKLNQLADQQLRSAIDAELSKKGLTATQGNADLDIAYQPAITQEQQFTSFSSGSGPGWGYGGGWGRYGFDSSTTTGTTSTIHIGSIGLDMYDTSQQKLVWRGEVSKTLDTKAKPEKIEKNLNKAVAKLLKNFPPPVKK